MTFRQIQFSETKPEMQAVQTPAQKLHEVLASILTASIVSCHVGLPETERGVADAFRVPHTKEKDGIFLFRQQYRLSGALYWWNNVPDFVRAGRSRSDRGALFRLFLCPNPKLNEVHMFRVLTTSRFLRLRHRILTRLHSFLPPAVATLALGALLMLPVLYFVEGM